MIKSLDARMKEYEHCYRQKLPKRLPVIIRIDGKAFHTYTKGMEKPFDSILTSAMLETSVYLAQNIMGCRLVYTQSDEISLVLNNYQKLNSEAWFDNNIQKMASVSASLATAKFNEVMHKYYPDKEAALFDSRVFILPVEEVNNYFVFRQQDAIKNSVSMLAQHHFKHKELQGLSGLQMKQKLIDEKEIDWEDLKTWQKRGATAIKVQFNVNDVIRNRWVLDLQIPVFTEDKTYVEKLI